MYLILLTLSLLFALIGFDIALHKAVILNALGHNLYSDAVTCLPFSPSLSALIFYFVKFSQKLNQKISQAHIHIGAIASTCVTLIFSLYIVLKTPGLHINQCSISGVNAAEAEKIKHSLVSLGFLERIGEYDHVLHFDRNNQQQVNIAIAPHICS